MAKVGEDGYMDKSPLLQHQDSPPPDETYMRQISGRDSDDLSNFVPASPVSVIQQSLHNRPSHAGDLSSRDASSNSNNVTRPSPRSTLRPDLIKTPENASGQDQLERLQPTQLSHRLSIRRASTGSRNTGRSDAKSSLSRSNSILQALSPSNLRQTFNFPSRNERYSTIQELDDLNEEEENLVAVDISFLDGSQYSHVGLSSQHPQPTLETGEYQAGPSTSRTDANTGAAMRVRSTSVSSHVPEPHLVEDAVRQYGQKLADEKKMIVSVQESLPAVDLGTLEGSDRSSLVVPNLKDAASSHVQESSFFYPADPEKPNWRPFPMRSPYLCMLIIVSLGLAGVQEYLYQKSQELKSKGQGLIRFDTVSDIPAAEFFAWKYLPTIVLVAFGVLWDIMVYDVKRLEPYYQLSQPTGNTAAKTINLDYVTLWAYFVPFKSIANRHWTVAAASIGSVLATTAAPSLQNPSVAPIDNPDCKVQGDVCEGGYKYTVQINGVWSRLVTVTLVLVAALAVILLFQLRRKSGLLSDPRGIAGIASMATKSHILNDFQSMDEATLDEIHDKLKRRRYVLYKSSIWQGEYNKYTEHNDGFRSDRNVQNPHPIILRRVPGIAFLVFLTCCLALIPVVTYTPVNVIVVKFPWLPVLVAVVVKQLWTTLEFAVKMLEPFYALSRGHARPELTLTLDYQGIPYGILPVRAVLNRHYLVALLGVGSVLSDVLTVTASSLSLQDESVTSFMASSAISTAITLFLVCSATLIWTHRRHPFLPRQPSTIASILAFIHQSRMLDDFVNTERFTNEQMRDMLVRRNKRYGLGWFRGRADAKPHCGVDEEPMLSKYVHGVSYIRATAPWEEGI